jgi:hypothetical protein
MNNKKLLIILGVLALIFFATKFFKSKNGKHSFDTSMIKIDTSLITNISISQFNQEKVKATKNGNSWSVSKGSIHSKANPSWKSFLGELAKLKVSALVSKNSDKWEKYELTDSLAAKVSIKQGERTINFVVGKMKYNIPKNQGQYVGRQNVTGITYIRVPDEGDAIYSVDGFLGMSVKNGFDRWRDNSFIQINKDEVTSVKVTDNTGSSTLISKQDSVWYVNGTPIDPTIMSNYLDRIKTLTITSFEDDFKPTNQANHIIELSGINMNPISVKAFVDTADYSVYMLSNKNPETYFKSDTNGVFGKLFISEEDLLE